MFWFFKISRKHFSQSEKALRLFYRNLPLRGTASLVLAIATTASPSRNDNGSVLVVLWIATLATLVRNDGNGKFSQWWIMLNLGICICSVAVARCCPLDRLGVCIALRWRKSLCAIKA